MNIEHIFEDAGGRFLTSYPWLVTRASRIKAVLLDWDGVFNAGAKGRGMVSSYTETDSMGLNMLRLAYWMANQTIPVMGVITGQNNEAAIELAQREHFHVVYSRFLNKEPAFNHLLETYQLEPNQVAYIYDDILDVAIADKCGLRILVNNKGGPLFNRFIIENSLADYQTASPGSRYAVREVCELMMGIMGNYDEVIKERIAFSETYRNYLAERNAISPAFYSLDNENASVIIS